ncbi:hypothetical protein [Pleionea mediterranea]|uniref:Uncharacterized protein n=1 Tax=Pleionea mediterranea TaxID=523701 RepID=A0A316FD47_9GAMM|nr:hypothetical protein [Pleionea mediterranea]PWK46343.1 hypothetical protein C8D97_11326 [Pleionea mediterranea]
MFKKFINGLVFGAGFAIAFIAVVIIYFQFFFESMYENNLVSSKEVVDSPPSIKAQKKYLGSNAVFSGKFVKNRNVLASGSGEIIGKAMLNGNPVSGLKLRLALNGSIMSQWSITNSEGVYSVSMPYAEYKIDGFELDSNSANALLAGKIDHPQNAHSTGNFEVSKEKKGQGLVFRFVDPIKKNITKNKYSVSDDVTLKWAAYSGASAYDIQLYEKTDPHAYIGDKALFEWSSRPRVSDTSFNLKEHGVELKVGNFYELEIYARDNSMRVISQTYRIHSGYDFEVTN